MHKTLSFVSLSYVPIHYMDYPRYCTRATSAILPRCFSHCANQYLSFHTIISATLVRFCHLAPQPAWKANPRKMFFDFVLMQIYKILQAIARLSRIFFDRYGRQCFLQPKAEMSTATKIKTILRRNGGDDNSFYFFFFVFLFSCSLFFRNITN